MSGCYSLHSVLVSSGITPIVMAKYYVMCWGTRTIYGTRTLESCHESEIFQQTVRLR